MEFKNLFFYSKLLHFAAKNNSFNIVNFLASQPEIEFDMNAFKECTKLTKINISKTINEIPMWCFYGCLSLVSVVIPSTTTSIDDFAFFGCSSLTDFKIPSSLTKIGEFAFAGCKSLQRVDLPLNLNSLGCSSFKGCSSLIKISIPSSVSTIGDFCFEGCSSLKEIAIPSSITKINKFVFRCCSSLENVIIPSSITIIDNHSFEGCISLKSISLPSSLNKIGLHSFDSCTSLTELIIPSNVTELGESFVRHCTSLIRIQIPSLVTKIENCSFKGCSSLIEVIIPPSVKTIGYDVFKGCSSLKQILIPSSVISIENKPFESDSNMTQIVLTESTRKSLIHSIPQFKEIKYFDKKILNKMHLLTQGSFTSVYSFRNQSEKLIAKCYMLSERLKEFFTNDIKIEMCIDYPSIIKFVGFSFIHNDKHKNAIIMENASKQNLNDVLHNFYDDVNFDAEEGDDKFNNFRFTNTLKQIFIIGIAGGLKYLHEIGITHCDISASNILIDENFHPKITGFSISFAGDNLIRKTLCGTASYIAPETFLDLRYNEKTDVYSFGILMYEILTGLNAFRGYSMHQICYAITCVNKRLKFNTPIKNSLQNLIERCWSQDPNNRPTFNEIFNEVAYNEDFYLDGVDIQQIKNYIDKLT